MAPLRLFREFIRNQGAMNGAPTQIPVGAAFMRPWRIYAALAHPFTTGFIRDQGAINGASTQISVGAAFMRPWRIYAALVYLYGWRL